MLRDSKQLVLSSDQIPSMEDEQNPFSGNTKICHSVITTSGDSVENETFR